MFAHLFAPSSVRLFLLFLPAVAITTGCTSLQSVSVTQIPSDRSRPVHAEVSNTALLGIHFDNDFVDELTPVPLCRVMGPPDLQAHGARETGWNDRRRRCLVTGTASIDFSLRLPSIDAAAATQESKEARPRECSVPS
jgi:hypothetical protein